MSETSKTQQEILQRLTRVETRMDMMVSARDIANEAQQLGKSAHKRLDSLEDNQKWLWRTVASALIVGLINLLFKIKGM
ncbi:hemolysin XhlA family protein [Paenibacillus allorhizosphaerae]|uniref:Hemolysin XhlA n=1 Tax=Paenibacillus allorhizosphaerae TaxID=2849866 RepID=A0ABN7TQW5_9BACL|nr:hemolysin XhlA family protein [Paenibacillus allorhizosphaerae]CAG7647390.1 hypothetical protein PAECIP111802_03963 [Paenibacillus allorhizosphaerae]